ncbi:hypothetical protein [Bradyrhizobium sp. Tv2a-2]|uniref:hypothetical protein n=1 Tax=Bradyrhizobium sp. Tv2a-2 TaxID=113395 RepID=UPI0003F8001A|nr:hypothetical protein [Bradyrhizobium sp. Tv2a-2]
MCAGLMPFAGHAGALPSLAIAIVSWIVAETLAGCAAYARAMYPALALDDLADPVGPKLSEPKPSEPRPSEPRPPVSGRPKNARPTLRVISSGNPDGTGRTKASQLLGAAQSRIDDGTDAVLRREQKSGARAGWRAAIIAAAIGLWSKIRQACVRRRSNADVQNLDERSRRELGVSRIDVVSIARCGGGPE